jgi:hypothetical protein
MAKRRCSLSVEWIEHFGSCICRGISTGLALMLCEYALNRGLFAARAGALSVSQTGDAFTNFLEAGGDRIDDSRNGLCRISGLKGIDRELARLYRPPNRPSCSEQLGRYVAYRRLAETWAGTGHRHHADPAGG